jgi:Fe-S cluster assembly protein SufD
LTVSNSAVDHYLAEFSALRTGLPGNSLEWLNQSRDGALDAFASTGFPTPRNEDWKYTRVTPIEKRSFKLAQQNDAHVQAREVEQFSLGAMACEQLVFVDGRYVDALSNRNVVDGGARITTLESAMNASSQLLESHLGHYASNRAWRFSTKPIRGSISTRSKTWHMVSTPSDATTAPSSWSPTISACSTTSGRISCIS